MPFGGRRWRERSAQDDEIDQAHAPTRKDGEPGEASQPELHQPLAGEVERAEAEGGDDHGVAAPAGQSRPKMISDSSAATIA